MKTMLRYSRLIRPLSNLPIAALSLSAAAIVAGTPAHAAMVVDYTATINITPFSYRDGDTPLRAGYDRSGDPFRTPNPVNLRLNHLSATGNGTIGNASAVPDGGGTVRATASTVDEEITSEARISYGFTLQPRPGVLVPDVVPLRVFALGSTGTEDRSAAKLEFRLNYYDGARTAKTLYQTTRVASQPGSVLIEPGNGNININEDINVFLGRVLSVELYAGASAGGKDAYARPQPGTGSAYLDPVFTLPAAYRDLIDIIGVPQGEVLPPPPPSGAVPEPASWAMMIVGLGAIGAQMRRRQLTHVASA